MLRPDNRRPSSAVLSITGIKDIPKVKAGDDLGELIVEAAGRQGIEIQDGDVVVVTQKIISKAEGRIVDLTGVEPTPHAKEIALVTGKDPRYVQVILEESRALVRISGPHLITETRHGFICANAGVDKSNVEGETLVSLLPLEPDASAQRIRDAIQKRLRRDVGVIVSDTFGRPWRLGQVNFAIGVAGLRPLRDYRGKEDMFRYTLNVTMMAVADELAAAAELVMNKADGVPVAIIRGYDYQRGEGSIAEIIRPAEQDLFR